MSTRKRNLLEIKVQENITRTYNLVVLYNFKHGALPPCIPVILTAQIDTTFHNVTKCNK